VDDSSSRCCFFDHPRVYTASKRLTPDLANVFREPMRMENAARSQARPHCLSLGITSTNFLLSRSSDTGRDGLLGPRQHVLPLCDARNSKDARQLRTVSEQITKTQAMWKAEILSTLRRLKAWDFIGPSIVCRLGGTGIQLGGSSLTGCQPKPVCSGSRCGSSRMPRLRGLVSGSSRARRRHQAGTSS
jgi:hypothetical protein